jgi:DNA-binding Lrp family transcriptional regulator
LYTIRYICLVLLYSLRMVAQIDDLDRRLIALLRANGRESVANLARRLKVTRATVNSRIDRLVDSGVIIGFSARVRDVSDPNSVRAVMLISVIGRNTGEVITALRGIPEIGALHTTNGQWDLVAEMMCDSLGTFDDVLGAIRGIQGIHDSETSILLSSATP